MKATLLLNVTGEPLGVVNINRAVVLVLAGRAEVVEASDKALRSERLVIVVPSIVRLIRYVRVPYKALAVTRHNLALRDGGRCGYCAKPGAGTIDHIVPRSLGGCHTWENVVLACRSCNAKKGSRTLSQLGWSLLVTPRSVGGGRWHVLAQGRAQPSWEPYLVPA